MGIRVCIVDDDDIYQFTTQRSLNKNPNVAEIIPFTFSEDALAFLKANKNNPDKLPHVLLLDINMPYIDGWDFLNEYQKIEKELCQSVDIYLISSSINSVDIKKSKEYKEVKRYIVKPVGSEIWHEIFDQQHTRSLNSI